MRETNLADWRRKNSRATDVKIVTQDSTCQKGSILVPNDGSLHSVLEDSNNFLELKVLSGESRYICKSAILYFWSIRYFLGCLNGGRTTENGCQGVMPGTLS